MTPTLMLLPSARPTGPGSALSFLPSSVTVVGGSATITAYMRLDRSKLTFCPPTTAVTTATSTQKRHQRHGPAANVLSQPPADKFRPHGWYQRQHRYRSDHRRTATHQQGASDSAAIVQSLFIFDVAVIQLLISA
ncbi:hypothetical protein GALMADRAFT_245924 [Galerina marginata CBS 339.88]|uniref:Uncharacterized protein n=1 Tax=Galerina marginata (strain CBS 339.88) TaxID=685588 RepID=A0A067T3Q8_GALM3|nr:hypothetical protein GALMADRAFT_245924 [Galerina marginata CBS 339.88]